MTLALVMLSLLLCLCNVMVASALYKHYFKPVIEAYKNKKRIYEMLKHIENKSQIDIKLGE